MKQLNNAKRLTLLVALVMCFTYIATTSVKAASPTASVTTNRAEGSFSYKLENVDMSKTSSVTLKVMSSDKKDEIFKKSITLSSDNVKDNTLTGEVNLSDFDYKYGAYAVVFEVGSDTIDAGQTDLSIDTSAVTMTLTGADSAGSRIATVSSSKENAIPGKDPKVSVMAWPDSSTEDKAITVAEAASFTNNMTIPCNVALGKNYFAWTAKLVVTDSKGTNYTVASTKYNVLPTVQTFVTKKSATLEKNNAFKVTITGLKNTYGVKSLKFYVYNAAGKKVATLTGVSGNASNSKFSADITMKKLGNKLGVYTIKATLKDNNDKSKKIDTVTTADQSAQPGSLSFIKKKNATTSVKLSKAYLPGGVKKALFVVYRVNGSKKKKLGKYEIKNSKGRDTISFVLNNTQTGTYKVNVYGYTSWGQKVFLTKGKYKLSKKHLGKNGWFYEKYNGKKYKFYYINNVKQTDLTKILNLKKSGPSHTNKFYIEVNRAACTVTIYMYNNNTKKYDIPVKTCTICVGRDTSTSAGAGALNENTSFTPIGNYSICSNGESVKYTLKTMHEPDGSICYARWTTHIVGNVYFHSIAVGTPSHHALPAYRFNLLGRPASAGCLRMAVADAKWIYDYASTGSTVKIVKGNSAKPGPLGKIKMPKSNGVNYDPTDPGISDAQKKKDYKAGRITGYLTKKGVRVGY